MTPTIVAALPKPPSATISVPAIRGPAHLVKRASELFARGSKAAAVEDAQKVIDDQHRKIVQLQAPWFAGEQPCRRAFAV
jgi:hypothetical protein